MNTLLLGALCSLLPLITVTDLAGPAPQDPGPKLDDGRVATVVDRQGIASVRPVGRERWTPLRQRSAVLPGDLLRTQDRGAHALEFMLRNGVKVVLGPDSLLEVEQADRLRLLRGEAEIAATPDQVIQCRGPGGFERAATGTIMLRATERETVVSSEAPRWLTGYRASTTSEWMGSLLAQVDGRDVPLTVGYHSVDVVVHDQVAQTTVEQSFVNSTDTQLEGTFFFPLPADASISGFGMWIGNELVEADIVEKQRARQIYEDILRRRKDPGLLEWAGGNLFKARVFPIEAHAEKRVRIRYTQVLPLEGSVLRYRYALRSDLLRRNPVRELSLRIQVASVATIEGLASPSHTVRARHTRNAGTLEFDAKGYAPDRDFEAAITLAAPPPVTAVAHRRGEDGYFGLWLQPPGETAGAWQRELLPEGKALDLLLVADTSGSMDPAARAQQRALLATLLELAGSQDRFRLLAGDGSAKWLQAEPVAPSPDNVRQALAQLDARPSLGWTDLDTLFADVVRASTAGTIVVYAGDGIGTTGDADPVALAQRLRALEARGAQWHALSTGATFEAGVLEAIAQHGGTVRAVGDDPADTAYQLLAEVAQPGIEDLRVEVRGLPTARLYPDPLPRLGAGRQQIVLGRFLPGTSPTLDAEVVVSGTQRGQPVRWTTKLALAAGEAGNSFLPRLWARRHLDALLAKGTSPAVQAEIVAFSQEFGILTPLTSLLVLENDEDRERYGVARRVKMRDGEVAFAQARDQATVEVLRQQMQQARTWRLRLREQMLRQIAQLGKDLHGWHVAVGGPSTPGVGSEVRSRREVIYYRGIGEGDALPAAKDDVDAGEVEPEELASAAPAETQASFDEESVRDTRLERQARSDDDFFLGGSKRRANVAHRRPGGWESLREAPPTGMLAPLGFPELGEPTPVVPSLIGNELDPEVTTLLVALDRRPKLTAARQGLRLRSERVVVDPLTGDVRSRQVADGLLAHDGFWTRRAERGDEPVEQWLANGQRGVLATGRRLARQRAALEGDRRVFPFPLDDRSFEDLTMTFRDWRGRVTSRDGASVTILLEAPVPSSMKVELQLDLGHRMLVGQRTWSAGKIVSSMRLTDVVEVAGLPWARTTEFLDDEGRITLRVKLDVEALDAPAYERATAARLDAHRDVLFAPTKEPTVEACRQAKRAGKAGWLEHLCLAADWLRAAQHDRALEALTHFEVAAADKPGASWLRAAMLAQARQGEPLRAFLNQRAQSIASAPLDAVVPLAMHAERLGHGVLAPAELLALHETLRTAWIRDGDDAVWRQSAYDRQRAALLAQANRHEEAVTAYEQLVHANPRDDALLVQHLDLLVSLGRHERGHTLAQMRIADGRPHNEVFRAWTQMLWDQRRLVDMTAASSRWLATNPTTEEAHVRWLSALLYGGRDTEADNWLQQRFAEAIVPTDAAQRARLGAAVQVVLGNGFDYWSQVVELRWREPLADLATRLAAEEGESWHLANRVLHDWRFHQTDACDRARTKLLATLTAPGAIAAMDLAHLGRVLPLLPWTRKQIDAAAFDRVVRALTERRQTARPEESRWLAKQLLWVLDTHDEPAAALALARESLAMAPVWERSTQARALLERLAREPWSADLETEMLGLLPSATPIDAAPQTQRTAMADALRWTTDALVGMRVKAELGPVQQLEQLPRNERRQREQAAKQNARSGLAAMLVTVEATATEPLRTWLTVERLGLQVTTSTDLAKIETEARALLAGIPPATDPDFRVLRERAALLLAYAATRKGVDAGLVERVVELFRQERQGNAALLDWSYQTFRLLVALDRPETLENELRTWIAAPDVEVRYRAALAYLLAELGRPAEAVATLDPVTAELEPEHHQALAQWQHALGNDPQTAQNARFAAMEIHELTMLLRHTGAQIARRNGGVAGLVEPETLLALRALLAKDPTPAQHLWLVRQLYEPTKDVRILACLTDGVLGHSPLGLYPYLGEVKAILDDVHEEATCDQVAVRAAELAPRATKATDQRGLALLRALLEHRAGQVLNQPGPHIERGVAALQGAFAPPVEPGEALPLGELLARLGALAFPQFGQLQVRQLEVLHAASAGGSDERLHLAGCLGTVRWAYGERDRAIDDLTTALRDHEAARTVLLAEANTQVGLLVQWLAETKAFAVAERFINTQLAKQALDSQRAWYQDRLHDVYVGCLQHDGTVAAGRGAAAFHHARDAMRQALFTCGGHRILPILQSFANLHRAAHGSAKIRSAATELVAFSTTALPEIVTRLAKDQPGAIGTIASALVDLDKSYEALELWVASAERESPLCRRTRNDVWGNAAWNIAELRTKVGNLRALEPRLLRLVLAALEHGLTLQNNGSQALFHRRYNHFWHEKATEFGAVAQRVLAQQANSPAAVLHISRYLWHGLDRGQDAVQALFAADTRRVLHEEGRWQLVQWLVEQRSFAPALPHAEQLVREQPDEIAYRCHLVQILHHVGRDADALTLAQETQTRFELQKKWKETAMAQLAAACLEATLFARSAQLFDAAAAERQRYTPSPDGQLAYYHGQAAQAYLKLQQLDVAVDRASAAVVAHGRQQEQRRQALQELRTVLDGIPDLDAFIKARDAQAAQSGVDAPVLRKLLGLVWLDRNQLDKAITQLRLARELDPLDADVHDALVRAHDLQGDTRAAVAALFGAVALAPRELSLYPKLAERLDAANDTEGAERAWTTVVEMLPHEAEGHRLLAQRRETQERFADAAAQWQQVVRVRGDEPEGWLSLAQAWLRAGNHDEARRTLQHVLTTRWDQRFGDVQAKAQELLGRTPSGSPR